MKVIELKDVKKTYHLEKLNVPVLHGIDLEINQGEFVAIMGHSGSGKSTLLNILGLLDQPTEGSYKLAGIEISKYTETELAALRNHYLGFVFQQFNLLPKLTVLENVALPVMYSNSKDGKEHADASQLLEMVGLSQRVSHKPNEISGGQQQRVAIARALINKPLIIFADEPTGNLDTKATKEIIKVLKDLNNSGITIVMVTHESELTAYATRTITVQDGLIVADKQTEHQKKEMPIKSEKKVSQKAFSIGRVKDYFVQAYRSLKGNKLRSLLSILGVMIGVSSLISMLAVGAGAKKSIEKEIANMGVNNLVVMPGFSQKGGISKETGAFRLKIDDIEDLKKNVKGIKTICGFYYNRAQIVANGHNHNTLLGGSSPGFQDLSDSHEPLNFGRLFTEKENIERKKVVILGETVVEKIYGDRKFNPVGKYIKINRIDFQVIGVDSTYEGRSRGDQDPDDQVVIPLNTALYRVFGTNTLKYLKLRVKDDDDMSKVSEDIITRLLFTHRVRTGSRDAVTVYNMADIQKAMASMSKSFSLLLGSIAFISLLVGGIGIMNIMFVSVSERTKEIGLRKAIGANNSDILFQFLIESVFVCCAGGVIGIIFGAGVSFIISKLAGWDAVITLFSIVLAFCFSCITGVVFGVWPARKASLLNPIEALRHD